MKDGDEERRSGKSWVSEPSFKTRRREKHGDRKGGVRKGCRGGVNTHLFWIGVSLGWRGEWPGSAAQW